MIRAFLSALTLTVCISAQTTGVVPINDLTVLLPPTGLPQGSGATSCNNLGFVPGAPFTMGYNLDAVGSTGAVLMLSFWGCTGAGIPFVPSAAPTCAGPLAGVPFTNLWFSLPLTPAPIAVAGIINAAGFVRWTFNIPAGPGTVWAQGVLIDVCSPFGFKFSQAQGFSW